MPEVWQNHASLRCRARVATQGNRLRAQISCLMNRPMQNAQGRKCAATKRKEGQMYLPLLPFCGLPFLPFCGRHAEEVFERLRVVVPRASAGGEWRAAWAQVPVDVNVLVEVAREGYCAQHPVCASPRRTGRRGELLRDELGRRFDRRARSCIDDVRVMCLPRRERQILQLGAKEVGRHGLDSAARHLGGPASRRPGISAARHLGLAPRPSLAGLVLGT
jgi:hypothetical protein